MKASQLKKTLHRAIDEIDEKLLISRYREFMSARPKIKGSEDNILSMLALLEDVLELQRNIADGFGNSNGDDMTLPGSPMTMDQVRERIESARKSAKNGNVINHEDFKEEMKSW